MWEKEAERPDAVHLYQMWVAPEARVRGVGQRLVEAVVAWARAADAREIRLGVADPGGPAARLYRRVAFGLDGGAGGCSELGSGCSTMRRALEPPGNADAVVHRGTALRREPTTGATDRGQSD